MTDIPVEVEFRALLDDFKRTFSTHHGKRVLLFLLDRGLYHQSVFTGNSKTYWNTGVQDYVRDVIVDQVMAADKRIYFDVLDKLIESRKVRKDGV